MPMWFFDDAGELEEYNIFRKEVQRIEREYLEIRVLLRDAEAAFKSDPGNEYLNAKVKYLKKRQKDLEKKGTRLSSDVPLEIAIWSPPHG